MAVMAAMTARQLMVRSERTVVCRLWSLRLIRRKRVGVRQCGGDGEGGRAGAGESSRAMAAMAMMAVMAGDSERGAAAKEERRQQAASSVSPWAKGGESSGGRGGGRVGAAGEAREIPQGKFPRCAAIPKKGPMRSARGAKKGPAQREMRRQNGQRETKFLFPAVVTIFPHENDERIILRNGSNGREKRQKWQLRLHMALLPGGPS